MKTKTTKSTSTIPSSMKTISTIEKVPNYFHSHMERAINAMAVAPNTVLRTLMSKNNVGLPGFIFYFMFIIAKDGYIL